MSNVCEEKCRCCNCLGTDAKLHRLTSVRSASVLQEAITLVSARKKPDGFGVHIQAALTVLAYLDARNKKTEAR